MLSLQQRKVMSKKDYKGVHHNFGGLLMGLGTATAVAGPVNTYLRSGTLRHDTVLHCICSCAANPDFAHANCHSTVNRHLDKHYLRIKS